VLRLDQEKAPEILRQAAILLEQENKRLVALVLELQRKLLTAQGKGEDAKQLRLQLAELEQKLSKQTKKLFGRSSEKRNGQEPSAEQSQQQSQQPPAKTGHGPRPQPRLPVIEQEHSLDEADKICPKCGGQLHEWEGQTVDSEQIDVVERVFVVRKHKRKKYVCDCGDCIETAEGPLKLFERSRYSIDFAVEVAASTYLDHIPLERQVRIMHREGPDTDSQTLWNQLDALAVPLRQTYARLLTHILGHDVIGADETTWKILGDKKAEKSSKTWQMWAVACPTAVYYKIQQSRSTACAEELLGGFEGTVMCDGYYAYEALAKKYECIEIAHCWSHTRRKFVEIKGVFSKRDRANSSSGSSAICNRI
jgi:transposase